MSAMQNGRAQMLAACQRFISSGMTVGTSGNISLRLDAHTMLITPSGLPYETLREEDFAAVDLRDLSFDGPHKPSVETPVHAAVYNARSELHALLHTHATYSCAFSLLGKELPSQLEDLVEIVGPTVRIAPQAFPGTTALRDGIVEGLKDRFAVIHESHGAFCAGRTMDEAFTVSTVLEKACHVYLLTMHAPAVFELDPGEALRLRDFYLNKYAAK